MTVVITPVADPIALRGARYTLAVASDGPLVHAAQRLRHQVFAGELGARLPNGATGFPGATGPASDIDQDVFDEYCDHLIIRDEHTDAVVGTYRLLPPQRAGRAGRSGRLYSDSEFDLTGLAPLRGSLVEAGRSCVHPDHRTGAVINLMWAGIARYLSLHGYRWLTGCASVPLRDGGATAAAVWQMARQRHLPPPAWRVRPRRPWPVDTGLAPDAAAGDNGRGGRRPAGALDVPPLLRGYLRLGAWICGPPAYDPDFNVADFLVLLAMDRVDPRYLRRFLEGMPPDGTPG